MQRYANDQDSVDGDQGGIVPHYYAAECTGSLVEKTQSFVKTDNHELADKS